MEVFSHVCYLLLMIFLIDDVKSKIGKDSFEHDRKEKEVLITQVQEKTRFQWPMGIVPYYLDNSTYDYIIAHQVRMAMNVLQSASCVRFKPIPTKPEGNFSWIHITNPQAERNCVHAPKYTKSSEIILVLGFDCLKEREILHTLLHALNFHDEVTHPHRDQYIRVLWNNIQPKYRSLYRIQTDDDNLMVEYDPLSIMHFHDRAFSMNGQATVMPLVPGLLISPSDDLSQLDKMRMRLLFDHECNKRKVGSLVDNCKMAIRDSIKPLDKEVINTDENNGNNTNTNKDTVDIVDEKPKDDDDDKPGNEEELGDEGDDKESNSKMDNDKNVDNIEAVDESENNEAESKRNNNNNKEKSLI